jgi:hypothetical protein
MTFASMPCGGARCSHNLKEVIDMAAVAMRRAAVASATVVRRRVLDWYLAGALLVFAVPLVGANWLGLHHARRAALRTHAQPVMRGGDNRSGERGEWKAFRIGAGNQLRTERREDCGETARGDDEVGDGSCGSRDANVEDGEERPVPAQASVG